MSPTRSDRVESGRVWLGRVEPGVFIISRIGPGHPAPTITARSDLANKKPGFDSGKSPTVAVTSGCAPCKPSENVNRGVAPHIVKGGISVRAPLERPAKMLMAGGVMHPTYRWAELVGALQPKGRATM